MCCSYFSCRSGIISEDGYCCSKQLDPTLIMAKQYTLVYAARPGCSKQTDTDWNLCVLCQAKTSEALQCPAHSKRTNVGARYRYVAENQISGIRL